MMRNVEMLVKDKEMGLWTVECNECPLKKALETLNMKPRVCVSGIVTKMQGAVTISNCEFLNRDIEPKGVGKQLSIDCKKVEE